VFQSVFARAAPIMTAIDNGTRALSAALLARLEPGVLSSFLVDGVIAGVGRSVSPLFAPLGWDWKITAAVLASFPAREVVIAVLGTLYAVENSQSAGPDATLISRMKEARRPDGTPMFSVPMALGLMMFYALCLQCVSTIAVMRRETNGWRWPAVAWGYMTALGYLGAFACYQLGTALGA
jgi:ferrous iron transport protein B